MRESGNRWAGRRGKVKWWEWRERGYCREGRTGRNLRGHLVDDWRGQGERKCGWREGPRGRMWQKILQTLLQFWSLWVYLLILGKMQGLILTFRVYHRPIWVVSFEGSSPWIKIQLNMSHDESESPFDLQKPLISISPAAKMGNVRRKFEIF